MTTMAMMAAAPEATASGANLGGKQNLAGHFLSGCENGGLQHLTASKADGPKSGGKQNLAGHFARCWGSPRWQLSPPSNAPRGGQLSPPWRAARGIAARRPEAAPAAEGRAALPDSAGSSRHPARLTRRNPTRGPSWHRTRLIRQAALATLQGPLAATQLRCSHVTTWAEKGRTSKRTAPPLRYRHTWRRHSSRERRSSAREGCRSGSSLGNAGARTIGS